MSLDFKEQLNKLLEEVQKSSSNNPSKSALTKEEISDLIFDNLNKCFVMTLAENLLPSQKFKISRIDFCESVLMGLVKMHVVICAPFIAGILNEQNEADDIESIIDAVTRHAAILSAGLSTTLKESLERLKFEEKTND